MEASVSHLQSAVLCSTEINTEISKITESSQNAIMPQDLKLSSGCSLIMLIQLYNSELMSHH